MSAEPMEEDATTAPAVAGRVDAATARGTPGDGHDAVAEPSTITEAGDPRDVRRAGLPVVEGYEVLGELGRGGMGVVYRARRLQLGRPCALKMILVGAHSSRDAISRFLAEGEAVAKLQHPNVVQIYHVGTAGGLPFFELEYVAGGSLDRQLGGTPWPVRRGVALVEALARGVAEAHARGIVHRDLKPSNVLMTPDGTPKVADFGLAKVLDSDAGLTRSEVLLGTPSYMAPEQAEGRAKQVGPPADVYALGVILYELITGRPPFRAASVAETLEQVKHAEPIPPSRLRPGLPRDLETICLTCLNKDPRRRIASAAELAEELRRFGAGEPIRSRPIGPLGRLGRWARRNPTVAALVSATVALLAAVAMVASTGYVQTSRALAEANRNLYRSLVGEARALRLARVVGYRPRALALLARARELDVRGRDLAELRQEAINSLGDFAGFEPAALDAVPPGVTAFALHPDARAVAFGQVDGTLLVLEVATGHTLARWQPARAFASALAFSPDGRTLLAGFSDGTIGRYQADATGAWTQEATAHASLAVTSVVTTPDGHRLACALDRGTTASRVPLPAPGEEDVAASLIGEGLEVRDLDAGTTAALAAEPGQILSEPRLSPDGRLVAAAYTAGEGVGVQVWDVAGRRIRGRLPIRSRVPDRAEIIAEGGVPLAFSPDASLLACGFQDEVVVYETRGFRPRLAVRCERAVSIAFHPSGKALAAGTQGQDVRLWSLGADGELATMKHERAKSPLFGLAFGRDGRSLASFGAGSFRLWDLAGARERTVLAGHAGGAPALAFSPDGAVLVSAGKDRAVRAWDPATGRPLRTLDEFGGVLQAVAFSPDGRLLATGDWAGMIRLWDSRAWRECADPLDAGLGRVMAVRFGPDGRTLLATGDQGFSTWRLDGAVDRPPGRLVLEATRHVDSASNHDLAVGRDGRLAAFIHHSNYLRVWDLARDREVPFHGPGLTMGYHSLGFLPDGRSLVYVSNRGVAEVWDALADRRVAELGTGEAFGGYNSALSPDGRLLAGEASATVASLWDLQRRRHLFNLPEEPSPIWSLAWSPDRRRLALGQSDGRISLWDLDEIRRQLDRLGLGW